ncbi:11845_t:CDS:2, partial [Entrophospora sp. SA101]
MTTDLPFRVKNFESWDINKVVDFLRSRKNTLGLQDKDIDIFNKKQISGESFLELTQEDLKEMGLEIGPRKSIMKLVPKLKTIMINCTATYKKVKETFLFVTTLYGSWSWLELRKQIKLKFTNQIEDVDEDDIYIKPNTYNNTINDTEAFTYYLERIPQDKDGAKNITFNVETCGYFYVVLKSSIYKANSYMIIFLAQINYSKYKKLSDLDEIFGNNIKSISGFNELPQINFRITKIVSRVVERLKLLIATSGPIVGKNEMERSYFIDALLREIVFFFGEKFSISQQYNVIGSHGDGRVDFLIMHGEIIICITEAKTTEIEEGMAQNFVQLHSACEKNIRKRKYSAIDDKYEYVYGIVSTGDQWIFTIVTSDNKLAAANKNVQIIGVHTKYYDEDLLKRETLSLVRVISSILNDSISNSSPQSKKIRIEKTLSLNK